MKKTSSTFHLNFIRSIFIGIICFVISLTTVFTVKADGAPPPEPDMGGVAPYQPIETNVQMMAETVLINVLPHPTRWTTSELNWNSNHVKVNATFTLRNQGTAQEQMQVIFPLTRLDYPWIASSYNIIDTSFVAKVNGQRVPTTSLSTPPELQAIPEGWDSTALPDGFFLPDVQWAGFDVTFPVQKDVMVEVEYEMWGDIHDGLQHVGYILETGAGWYGKILSAEIILRLPYPATKESVGGMADGCIFADHEVQCKMEDIEPTRDDNLSFGFLDTNEWVPTLELRSRVEQYPDDAHAWYALANQYETFGFWYGPGGVAIRDQHFIDLAIEAFEKALELDHTWGDAHLSLAHILWFGTPKQAGKLTADAPLVQRVTMEMQLAAYHGITGSGDSYSRLSWEILHAIPDLEKSLLPVPNILAPVASAATMTPGPTSDVLQKVDAVAVGNYHTCALTDSSIKCDGWNLKTQVSGAFKAAVAGDFFTCMLTTESGVQCMGANNFGQLGNGNTTDSTTPVDVVGLASGVSTLVAGDNHACALMRNGGVKCWGRNYFGQLGDGTTAYSVEPVDVHGLSSSVAALSAGSNHTCALMSSGAVKCWGANEAGQLGDGSLVNRSEPVDITTLSKDITVLAAGFTHTCALNLQRQLLCWGDNSHGQLGDDNLDAHTSPMIVPGLPNQITKVAAGNGYTCVLTKSEVECWGLNDFGQLGDGTTDNHSTPVAVDGLTNVVDIAAGNNHNCALLQDGHVHCWGMTEYGYRGLESQYVVQFDSPPATISESTPFVPVILSTAMPAQTKPSSPTIDIVWDFVMFIAICILALLYRRLKVASRK